MATEHTTQVHEVRHTDEDGIERSYLVCDHGWGCCYYRNRIDYTPEIIENYIRQSWNREVGVIRPCRCTCPDCGETGHDTCAF